MILTIQNKNKMIAWLIAGIFTLGSSPNLSASENPPRPKVIFIQDAHSNYEAQSQIRDILKKLTAELKPVTILVEGASQSLDPTMFQFTYSRELNKQITEKLSEKGFVSGAELFTLEPESASVAFSGLEDEALYQQEKSDFMSVISGKPDTERMLSILRSQLDALKARVFNSKLKDIDRKFSAYENGKTTLLSWFDSLAKLVNETLGLSLNDPREAARFPNLVRLAISRSASEKINASALEAEKRKLAATLSDSNLIRFVRDLGTEKQSAAQENFQALAEQLRIDWLKYPEIRKATIALLLSNEMEGTALFREMEDLKNAIYERLAQTDAEKKTAALDRNLRLLDEILSLESTRDVWNSVKENVSSISPAEWMRRLKELSLGVKNLDGDSVRALATRFERAIDFYTLAEKREQIFMKKIQDALPSGNVIVVSGGFHAEGLERAAHSQNFDFSVIQPQLKNKGDISQYYQAIFQSNSLPFLSSKMAAEPFNETDFHAGVLAGILTAFKNGTLPVTVSVGEVNESPFMVRIGGQIVEKTGRFEFEAAKGTSLAVTNQTLFPMAETEEAFNALAAIQRQPNFDPSAIVEFNKNYFVALMPEKIGKNLEVQKAARFYVKGANVFIGRKFTVRNIVSIQVAPTGRLIIGNNVTFSNVNINVGEGQTVIIGDNINLTGNIFVAPMEVKEGQPAAQFPALIIGNGARVALPVMNIPPDAQVVIPWGTTGIVPENIQIPASQSTALVEPENAQRGLLNSLRPQPNTAFLPLVPDQSLGTPGVNRVFNRPSLVPPSVPNVPTPNRTPVNIPKLLPTSSGFVPSMDRGGNFQDLLDFIMAARAGVAPEDLSREQLEALAQEIESESALLRPLVREGILTPVVARPSQFQRALSADLAKLPQGVNRQFLEGLVHNLKNHRVAVTVGVSDPQGLYSLASPEFRDSVAFHLETNPNSVFRFVHLGSEAEVKRINDYFIHFDKRFEVVSGNAGNWSDKLRALLGEDLMLAVNRLPAGLQIQNLDSLYKGRHIAIVLPKAYWQANPALPHSAVVKVTSLSNDSRLKSQVGRNAKAIADLAYLETSLSQLVSMMKGNFRDLLQFLPYDVFSYSGGRFSLNSATLLSGLLEGIHEQAIALQKLAYQA